MNWKGILICIACALAWAVAAQAQVVSVVGNDDEVGVRVGYRPGEKGEMGLFGLYTDGLKDGTEAAGGGLYATWDVMAGDFDLLGYKVPSVLYAGGLLGVLSTQDKLKEEGRQTDAIAALMTGLSFGDETIRIGIEAQYAFSKEQWRALADVDENSKLLLNLSYRF